MTNPYVYGFPMNMPLFCDKQVKSDVTCLKTLRKQPNVLRQTLTSQFYTSRLRETILHHGISLTTGSQLMFASSTFKTRHVSELSISELAKILDFNCLTSYNDQNGEHHTIFLPSLLCNCQYFWSIFYWDKDLTKAGVLNFDPAKIVKDCHCHKWPIPSKPADWSYNEYESFCDLYITVDALEAVLLYINYGNINYNGSLRAYIAACIYLQTDSALLYLFECQEIVYENYLVITKAVLNNFGPAHPVFEFLVLYGSSNIFNISFYDLLNILAVPNDVCHFLCVNKSNRRYDYRNCKFVLKSNTKLHVKSEILISLGNKCNSAVEPNRFLESTDRFYCEGLAMFFEEHCRSIINFTNCYEQKCVICKKEHFHWPKISYDAGNSWQNRPGYIPEILFAQLTCCLKVVHRTCFHALFCETNDWFCPCCRTQYTKHFRVFRMKFTDQDTFLHLMQPYKIFSGYCDSNWGCSFYRKLCSRPAITQDFLCTHVSSL